MGEMLKCILDTCGLTSVESKGYFLCTFQMDRMEKKHFLKTTEIRGRRRNRTKSGINTSAIYNKTIKMKDKEGNWRYQFLWAIRESNHVFLHHFNVFIDKVLEKARQWYKTKSWCTSTPCCLYAPQKLFKWLLSHVLDDKFSNNNKSPPNMLCYHLTSLILVVSHNTHNS